MEDGPAKRPLGPGHEVLLPAMDERRVNGVVTGQRVNRLVTLVCGQGDLGLERW